MNPKIQQILETSKDVFLDSCLENGAIVAAPSHKKYYPPEAKSYFYVWPRDAAFTCIAAKMLGLTTIQEPFFAWCMKAEGWEETGLFYKKYSPDGTKARQSLQVDQNAMVLIALHDFYGTQGVPAQFQKLLTHTADGLCAILDKDHFIIPYQELWEQRYCFPDLEENFSYSLAACYRGLLCANELIQNSRWKEVAEEMKTMLLHSPGDYFYRSFGRMNDVRSDASLLGLVWPFGMVASNHPKMKKTIEKIETKLVKNKGVHRFEHDDYDGWMYQQEIQRKKGSGYWPLLNFWMSIVLAKMGRKQEALEYFQKAIENVENFIPEQVFDNPYQKSVSPLCWSHAMFVIASKELEFL